MEDPVQTGERAAVQRLKSGDIGGLEELVRRYQVQALKAAYLVTRDRHLAEDVVQASFVRAYERIVQFDSHRSFGPWFLRSVVNAATKAAVQQGRVVGYDEHVDAWALNSAAPQGGSRHDPEAMFEQAETRRELADALWRLSHNQRASIVLRYFLDLSEAEMAEHLTAPPGTIKRWLYEGRHRLKGFLTSNSAKGDQLSAPKVTVPNAPTFPGSAQDEVDG
jgi:RNA polymerase sigma-70 factor, ECF subfamily